MTLENTSQEQELHDTSVDYHESEHGMIADQPVDFEPDFGPSHSSHYLDKLEELLAPGKSHAIQLPTVLVILVLSAVLIGIFWAQNPNLLVQIFDRTMTPPRSELVDAVDGRILVFRREGAVNVVEVEIDNRAASISISKGDMTAHHPSLSPDGNFVAFLSEQNDGQLVLVSLTGTERWELTNQQVVGTLGNEFAKPVICPWTSVTWAPSANKMALFICSEQLEQSRLAVIDMLSPDIFPVLQAGSAYEGLDSRQAMWLNESEVLMTIPASELFLPSTVRLTISLP